MAAVPCRRRASTSVPDFGETEEAVVRDPAVIEAYLGKRWLREHGGTPRQPQPR
jgi:hypothetical protein